MTIIASLLRAAELPDSPTARLDAELLLAAALGKSRSFLHTWPERIRTYNYAQGRVTDHRVNLTLYSLDEILAGGVEAVIEPLLAEYQADQLAAIGE